MNYGQQSLNNQASFGLAQGRQVLGTGSTETAAPRLMDLSIKQLHGSLEELSASVEWLVQKIQPICQPQPPMAGDTAKEIRAVDAPPSSLRADILQAKAKVERISQTIASVRYLIEV